MIRVPFYKIIRWSIVLIMVFQVNLVSGQIPVIPVPQHVEMNRYDNLYQNPHSNILNIISSSHSTFIQKQKESIIREVEENERKRVAINKQYILREYLKSNSIPLPNFSETPGTEYFHSARKEILEMLEGKKAMSLKRAVFITENAFFQNKMKYEEFDTAIQNLKHICLLKMQEEKLDMNDELAKLMMVFRILSEVVEIKEPGTEKTIVHHPIKYDFDDYNAKNNAGNYMISKLLSQNTGQCHSMPLLFLILAEEMGTEAFWCFSPSHSFIKFKDKQGRWYNIELTQGAVVTDDFYMNSGFIKSKAIQTGIYLKPLTSKQTIAHMLNDLSFYYISRYDYDHFVDENSDLVLHYAPSDLTAYQLQANICTAQAIYVINACGRPPKERLPEYPQAYRLFKRMLQSYEKIDSLGYEDMPAEMYHNWLKQLDKAKTLPENQASPVIQIKK
ncbi:hypothetical protein [Bacteroides nordii]|uniref:hypothetical protein n=2 Tax=Bacteroides TaxID=816 RepID=UPI0026DB87E2|nr:MULTISPECIES: hypothetical protein [Bacteroides]